MRSFLLELSRRNRVLAFAASAHLGLFVLALLLSMVDERQVMGVNAWVKPMKFMFSIALYTGTLAWFAGYLDPRSRLLHVLAIGIAVAMFAETACIWTQAARGATSHFNRDTLFDERLFQVMGLMIVANTTFATLFLLRFFRRTAVQLEPIYLWSIRLGLALFILGSLQGFTMIARDAHTVGAPDGGPGLPFLNWSTEAGDLRAAHALGLHGLQAFPLAGWLIATRLRRPLAHQALCLAAFGLLYTGAFLVMNWLALSGVPVLRL